MSRALLGLSRFLCGAAILASPWLLSGRPLSVQVALAVALAVAWFLWMLGRLIASRNASAGWSASTTGLVVVWSGLIALALAQLVLPLDAGLPARHAVVARIASDVDWPQPVAVAGTQIPALTRLQLSRFIWPLIALVLGAELFAEPAFRRGLWLLLGINGAALTVFGIVQRLTWNEQLYWIFPQPFQGQPFASFWNRNHAAGYLNLCLAAVVGLLVAGLRRAPDEWWPSRSQDSQPTFRAGIVQVLLLALAAGVIATVSRGGIVACIAAAVVMIVTCLAMRATFIARQMMTLLIGGAVLAASLGMWQLAQSRFDQLDWRGAMEDGRWRHWQDMLPAWNDVWHSGTGLGTYRYANRPYQNHALATKYWNADNQYLEFAVEGGVPAVALIVAGGVVLLCFVRQTWRPALFEDEDTADLGPVVLFVTIAQGIQAFTDYGISIPANALTMALMLGALTGGRGWRAPVRDALGVIPSRRLLWQWLPALAVTICAVTGVREIYSTAEVDAFHQALPSLENPKSTDWTPLEVDAALGRADRFLADRPDDFQLYRTVAKLHILRYRQELLVTMQDPRNVPKPLDAEVAWRRTEPPAWDVLCRQWVRSGNLTALQSLQNEPVFLEHLPVAYAALQRARDLCPFDPQTDQLLGLLAYPCGNGKQQRDQWLRSAVFSAPGEPKFLREIAILSESVRQDDLAAFCWRRAIALDPSQQDAIFREAAERLAPGYVLEHVLEPDAGRLLRFAEVIDDPLIRELTAQRLASLLKQKTVSPTGEILVQLGRLALLEGDREAACEQFRQAVRLEPLRWEWRLAYAETLVAQNETDAALDQVQAGLRVAPEQPQLLQLKQTLMPSARSQPKR